MKKKLLITLVILVFLVFIVTCSYLTYHKIESDWVKKDALNYCDLRTPNPNEIKSYSYNFFTRKYNIVIMTSDEKYYEFSYIGKQIEWIKDPFEEE